MKKYIFFFLLIFALSSCKSEYDRIEVKKDLVFNTDQSQVLQGLGDIENAITIDWLNAVNALQMSVNNFIASPDDAGLQNARSAWRTARDLWEGNESFAFGPVSDAGIDGATDTWPFDEGSFKAILNSSVVLSSSYIIQMSNSTKGFHAIEYLLFDKNGNKSYTDFTSRELTMLSLLTADLKKQSQSLNNFWTSGSSGSFYDSYIGSGTNLSQYASTTTALGEVLGSMVGIMTELPDNKIENPLTKQNPAYAESYFSDYSLNDYINNINGVQNAYLGTYKNLKATKSISNLVQASNPSLDQKVKVQLKLCLALANLIKPATFNEAVSTKSAQLRELQTELRNLNNMLATEVSPLLGIE